MYLSSKEAAALLKRGGRTPVARDLRRWVRDGYRVTTPAGVTIVKLRAVQLPGGISFTQQQIAPLGITRFDWTAGSDGIGPAVT